MTHALRRSSAILVVAFIAAIIARPASSAGPAPATVTVGIVNALSDVPIFIAEKKGDFGRAARRGPTRRRRRIGVRGPV